MTCFCAFILIPFIVYLALQMPLEQFFNILLFRLQRFLTREVALMLWGLSNE